MKDQRTDPRKFLTPWAEDDILLLEGEYGRLAVDGLNAATERKVCTGEEPMRMRLALSLNINAAMLDADIHGALTAHQELALREHLRCEADRRFRAGESVDFEGLIKGWAAGRIVAYGGVHEETARALSLAPVKSDMQQANQYAATAIQDERLRKLEEVYDTEGGVALIAWGRQSGKTRIIAELMKRKAARVLVLCANSLYSTKKVWMETWEAPFPNGVPTACFGSVSHAYARIRPADVAHSYTFDAIVLEGADRLTAVNIRKALSTVAPSLKEGGSVFFVADDREKMSMPGDYVAAPTFEVIK